jgi:hypothetical protein
VPDRESTAVQLDKLAKSVIDLWGKRVRVQHEEFDRLCELGCDMSLYKIEDKVTLARG